MTLPDPDDRTVTVQTLRRRHVPNEAIQVLEWGRVVAPGSSKSRQLRDALKDWIGTADIDDLTILLGPFSLTPGEWADWHESDLCASLLRTMDFTRASRTCMAWRRWGFSAEEAHEWHRRGFADHEAYLCRDASVGPVAAWLSREVGNTADFDNDDATWWLRKVSARTTVEYLPDEMLLDYCRVRQRISSTQAATLLQHRVPVSYVDSCIALGVDEVEDVVGSYVNDADPVWYSTWRASQ